MTDKIESGLLKFYDNLFEPYKDKEIKLLEIGILFGECLEYWADYFSKAELFGFDFRFLKEDLNPRITLIKGLQDDSFALRELGNTKGPFDIIVDDCSHYGQYTQNSFDFLFGHLTPGGLYIIEDWTAGFKSPQFRGIDKVLSVCLENFDNYKIKEVRALRLPEGGTVAVIQKI